MGQRDNSTLILKVSLRRNLLKEIKSPVVMETHGGNGVLWRRCYDGLPDGVVFEKDPKKASVLGKQRPCWAIYEADCVAAMAEGVGGHLDVNFVDFDPYGEPWPAIDAYFESERPRPDRIAVAVNDGLRQGLKMGRAWGVGSMLEIVKKYGNDIYQNYLEICRELLEQKAAQRDYKMIRWAGYYCGHAKQMTHYGAIFELI